jgi:hypothetical protein
MWVGAHIIEVTVLSTIVSLSVSSDLVHTHSGLRFVGVQCRSRTLTSIRASIGKIKNLSTIETRRGRFS